MRRTKENLARLRRTLAAKYGDFSAWGEDFPLLILARDPLETLVATVLSQATNDRNSARAYQNLRRAFPTWASLAAAPEDKLAVAIACGGLGPQKARTLKAILAKIEADLGALSLDALQAWPEAQARRYLVSLPGVGPKTAACVQLFSLGQRAFPVDVHIHRVARRLGLAPPKAVAAAVQELMERTARKEDCFPLHLLLIEHGRKICRPAAPRCGECPLREECVGGRGPLTPRPPL